MKLKVVDDPRHLHFLHHPDQVVQVLMNEIQLVSMHQMTSHVSEEKLSERFNRKKIYIYVQICAFLLEIPDEFVAMPFHEHDGNTKIIF
jgi:hypothetical protein